MPTIANLLVKLGANTSEFDKKMGRSTKTLSNLGAVAGITGIAIGAALATGFVKAIMASANFEQSMNKVRAITQATTDEFDDMRRSALELGRTTQFSASQAAEAMTFLGMAGFGANEIIGAMPSTLELAAAAAIDLGMAADITSNILTGFNLQVSDLAQANDALVATITSTNTTLVDLAQAMSFVAPIAAAAGLSLNETSAAIGLLGNAGIKGSRAGVVLRRTLSSLLNPTDEEARLMRQLGINAINASGQISSLTDVIISLERSGAGAQEILKAFGDIAGPGMAALVAQGSNALVDLNKKLAESGGIAERVAKQQMEGLHGALKRLSSAAEGFAITIGDIFNPAITSAANLLASFLSGLNKDIQTSLAQFRLFGKIVSIVFNDIATSVLALGRAIGKLVTGDFTGALEEAQTALSGTGTVLADIAVAMSKFQEEWQAIGATATNAADTTSDAVDTLARAAERQSAFTDVATTAQREMNAAMFANQGQAELTAASVDNMTLATTALTASQQFLNNFLRDNDRELMRMDRIQMRMAGTITGTMMPAVSTMITGWRDFGAAGKQAIEQLITSMIRAVAQALILQTVLSFLPGGGFTGGGFLAKVGNRVLGLADGGMVTRPTLAMVGEAGPEAVIPLSKMANMGGVKNQTIIIELDSEVIGRASATGMPEVLRVMGVAA